MRKRASQETPRVEDGRRARISVESERVAALEAQQEKRAQSSNRRRVAALAAIAAVILFITFILPEGMLGGISGIDSFTVFSERVVDNVGRLVAVLANTNTGGNYALVVCRYTAAFLMGAALGSCGAVYQGSFRNPLASPSTLGVVAGCLLGAVLYYLFMYDGWIEASLASATTTLNLLSGLNPLEYVWVVYGRAICAVLGGFAVVGTALLIARAMGGAAVTGVVLVVVGQVLMMVADSSVDLVRYYLETSGDIMRATLVQLAEVAPFSTIVTFLDLALVGIPIVIGLVVLLLLRNRMNVLTFSDAEARSLGVDIGRFRTGVVLLCTAITGVAVGFCGPVGMVGFVAPHVARRIVSPDFRYMLPASLLIGAIFLVIAEALTMQTEIGADQGVNLITTVLGCIVFLVVAFKSRGGTNAWR